MQRFKALMAVATVLAMGGGSVQAAQLLTDGAGYTGPVIDLGVIPYPGFFFGNAPRVFGNVTISGNNIFNGTAYGQLNYGFTSNGLNISKFIVATSAPDASVFIDFATPVPVFGAGFNYIPSFPYPVLPPTLSAFDSNGDLIGSYDLLSLAPIDAGGQNDFYAFRGIDGQGRGISRFVFAGSYIAMNVAGSVGPAVVPEPTTWAMLVLGFGAVGAAARRRRVLAV